MSFAKGAKAKPTYFRARTWALCKGEVVRVPIVISLILVLISIGFICWMLQLEIEHQDLLSPLISTFAVTGALISLVFVMYGYFINLSAFRESQKPRLLFQVHNGQARLEGTNKTVHQTVIAYSNVSLIECRNLSINVKLVGENETIEVPRLFSKSLNIPPNDSRNRHFPTKVYLLSNGIPQQVIDKLDTYKLRIEYSYKVMGEEVTSFYDYSWDSKKEWWGIA